MKYFFALIVFLLTMVHLDSHAQSKQNPVISEFGGIYEIPEATKRPDPSLQYNLVIDVKAGGEDSAEMNRSLVNIARTLNLHVQGGVPKENIQIVAVIHAEATPVVLGNKAYQQHFGIDNPNDALIHALKDAGVEIYVCGQSLIARKLSGQPLHPDIQVSISALTILTEYQLNGYALLSF